MSVLSESKGHIPVMLDQVLETLNPSDNEEYIDATFGAGGYTGAILRKAPQCSVIAIDRDQSAMDIAGKMQKQYGPRLKFYNRPFSEMENIVREENMVPVNGVVMDLGVSSMQLDQAERGFSFRFDGPLDMRMDTGQDRTAADIVNAASQEELADIFYKYGEERHSRKIARTIIVRRANEAILTTAQLADIVEKTIPKNRKDKSHPATRVFQALRIAVNDELSELEKGLTAAERVLAPEGRFVIVTFHSLEDRRVKTFFKTCTGQERQYSRHLPVPPDEAANQNQPSFRLVTRQSLKPSEEEIRDNPRARSAKLRYAIRTDAPPLGTALKQEART